MKKKVAVSFFVLLLTICGCKPTEENVFHDKVLKDIQRVRSPENIRASSLFLFNSRSKDWDKIFVYGNSSGIIWISDPTEAFKKLTTIIDRASINGRLERMIIDPDAFKKTPVSGAQDENLFIKGIAEFYCFDASADKDTKKMLSLYIMDGMAWIELAYLPVGSAVDSRYSSRLPSSYTSGGIAPGIVNTHSKNAKDSQARQLAKERQGYLEKEIYQDIEGAVMSGDLKLAKSMLDGTHEKYKKIRLSNNAQECALLIDYASKIECLEKEINQNISEVMKCWQKPKLKYRNELLSAEEKFIKARLPLSQEFNSWLNDKKTNLTASLA